MSKANNLTDFLTDTANAIRAKKGTTAKIDPQDFASEISGIQTGGEISTIYLVAGEGYTIELPTNRTLAFGVASSSDDNVITVYFYGTTGNALKTITLRGNRDQACNFALDFLHYTTGDTGMANYVFAENAGADSIRDVASIQIEFMSTSSEQAILYIAET